MQRDIIWLAYGLNRQLTGIERVILGLLEHSPQDLRLVERLTIFVDEDAAWPINLPPEVDIRLVSSGSKIPRLLRNLQRPDSLWGRALLVHSFGPLLPPLQRPAIYTVHDWGPFQRHSLRLKPRLIWGIAVTGSVRRASVLHALTNNTYSTVPLCFRKIVGNLPKVVSLPPPPETMPVTTSARSHELPDKPFLMYVGSADPRKRLGPLVEAVGRNPQVRLVLAGDGTEQYRGAAGVTALGRVDDSMLAVLYEECSALVLISEMEGLGLPVIEAASRGKMSLVSPEVANVQPSYVRRYLQIVDINAGRHVFHQALSAAMTASTKPRLNRLEVDPSLWQTYQKLLEL